MPESSASLLVGAILAIIGLIAIVKRHFALDFKGGFTITLTEARALLFGVVSLIAGLSLIGSALAVLLLHANLNQGTLTLATLFAAAVCTLTFVIELLLEGLVAYAAKKREKQKR